MRLALLFCALLVALALGALRWDQIGAAGPTANFEIYRAILVVSGVAAFGMMAAAMLLALRLPLADRWMGGLDRVYGVHRASAYLAVGFAAAHWAAHEWLGPWMREAGLMPARGGGGGGGGGAGAAHRTPLFDPVRDLAKTAGEWALYLMLALVAVALIRAIPYRRFTQTHRLMAVVFLLASLHAIAMMPPWGWSGAVGWPVAALAAAGLVAAGLSAAGWIGLRRRVPGRVTALRDLGDRVLEVEVELAPGRWRGHRAGQFALVTFDPHEGAHPFTIASAWGPERRLRFDIKALGDYTAALPAALKPGDAATVEGPYGGFDGRGGQARQIWVAGGAGLAPFTALLEAAAAKGPDERRIDLFHCAKEVSAPLRARLEGAARAAGVRLHLLVESEDGLLTPERLMQAAPDWAEAGIWFCGPRPFGDALEAGLRRAGLPAGAFHREAFEFR